jgi:hypothetical protein
MSRLSKLKRELRNLLDLMVQGGLSQTTRTCGTPSCACHRDPARRHGPHLYWTFRAQGKSCALYVPAQHARQAHQAQAAWARFWEIGCQLSTLNRKRLLTRWKRERA